MTEYSFIVPGRPRPKERANHKKTGHSYTPKRTREWEEYIASLYDGPVFLGPIGSVLTFTPEQTEITLFDRPWSSPLRGDIDNYQKLVFDALQPLAFPNDREVVYVEASKA